MIYLGNQLIGLNTTRLCEINSASSSSIVNFKSAYNAPLVDCKVNFTPIQEGSGTPSPSNVRPISGWTGVGINVMGQNLFDYENANIQKGQIRNDSGTVVSDANGSYGGMIPVKPETTYTMSGFSSYSAKRAYYLDKDGNWISRSSAYSNGNNNSFSITTPANCYWMQVQLGIASGAGWSTLQVEPGSTATTYTSYSGSTINIQFPETVYSGTLDTKTGILTATHGIIEAKNLNWEIGNLSSPNGQFFTASATVPFKTWELEGNISALSNTFAKSDTGTAKTSIGNSFWWNNDRNGYRIIYGTPNTTTVTELLSFLTQNNVIFFGELNTPQTYQLTPTKIYTLQGTNNIWTDANGTIELKYWDTIR